MALDFQQTDTDAPFGAIAACSGLPAGTTVDQSLCEVGGTPGSTELLVDHAGSAGGTRRLIHFELDVPAGTTWAAGDWTVSMGVTTQSSQLIWDTLHICRVDSGGTPQATIASVTGLGIKFNLANVSHTLAGSAQTPSAGDRVYIVIGITNNQTMSNTVGITPSDVINSPFEAAAPVLVEDNFDRANSDTVGNDSEGNAWVEVSGDYDIFSNGVIQTDATTTPGLLRCGTNIAADHWMEVTLAVSNGTGQIGFALRVHDTAFTGVFMEVADGAFKVIEVTNGNPDTVSVGDLHTHATGERYRAEVEGNTVRLFLNDVEVHSFSTSFAAGNTRVGLHLNENASGAVRFDDFRAGTLPYTAPGTTGSLVETQDDQTLAAAGQLGHSGSLAETQDDQTLASAGQLGHSGSLAETQDDQTLSASGTVSPAQEQITPAGQQISLAKPRKNTWWWDGTWFIISGNWFVYRRDAEESWSVASASLASGSGYRFDVVVDRSTGDVYFHGWDATSPIMGRLTYDGDGTYTIATNTAAPTGGDASNSASIALDSDGLLWISRGESGLVRYLVIDTADWSTAQAVTTLDTASAGAGHNQRIVAFTDATGPSVGILMDDTDVPETLFWVHRDGDPLGSGNWSSETVFATDGDDHGDVVATTAGEVLVVQKTSQTGTGVPNLIYKRRTTAGSWVDQTTVATRFGSLAVEEYTAPRISYDETNDEVWVVAERRDVDDIYRWSSPRSSPDFGSAALTIDVAGALSNVVFPAQSVDGTTDLFAHAQTATEWWGFLILIEGTAGVTGALDETQDDQTLAATGQIGFSGSLAETQADQTLAASGQLGHSGSLDETQDDQTLASSGQIGFSGSLVETQDDQTLAASGTVGDVSYTSGSVVLQDTVGAANIPVGLVTEAEQGLAASAQRAYDAGQTTEVEVGQAVASRKIVPVGQATETETGQATTSQKVGSAGQVVETETGQDIILQAVGAVGQVVETETGQAVTSRKVLAVGQVVESETGLGASAQRAVPVAPAFETEIGQATTSRKLRSAGLAVEGESGLAVSASGVVSVGQTTESEAGLAATARKVGILDPAPETEQGQATTSRKVRAVGQVAEVETGLSAGSGQVIGQAIETESPAAITVRKVRSLGQAVETETGLAAAGTKVRAVAQVVETEAGQSATAAHRVAVDPATEAETGFVVGSRKTRGIGQAVEAEAGTATALGGNILVNFTTETEAGLAVASRKVVAVGPATETEVGLSATVQRAFSVGTVDEVEAPLDVGSRKLRGVGQTTEAEAGLAAAAARAYPVGVVPEAEAGLSLDSRKLRAVETAVETELATQIALALHLGEPVRVDRSHAVSWDRRSVVSGDQRHAVTT